MRTEQHDDGTRQRRAVGAGEAGVISFRQVADQQPVPRPTGAAGSTGAPYDELEAVLELWAPLDGDDADPRAPHPRVPRYRRLAD